MPASRPRLELVWPGKDQFLLTPTGEDGKPVWVDPDHPAAHEVRLTEFTGAYGQVNEDDPYADNLLFTGDSLDVLRVLCQVPEYRQHYRGKVKLIYIDPPFNTGQTFAHYDDWMEHSTWLSFMRDRLVLMKELLATDGSIWVPLDDAEVHRMRCLLDEVFGAQNAIATVVWQKADSPRNSARHLSVDQDYILIYALNAEVWRPNRLPRTADSDAIYRNPDDDPRGAWLAGDPYANKPYSLGQYTIIGPTGREFRPPEGRYWRISEEKLRALDDDGRIWWGPAGDARPSIKRYLSEVGGLVPRTVWLHEEVGSNRTSNRESKAVVDGAQGFATPKPERLIQRVLQIGSNQGDIIVDAFAGSGTTAAVAQKMGRRWLTVELSLNTVEDYIVRRLGKVLEGLDPGGITKDVEWEGGGGFRTVTVGPSMYEVTPIGVMLADWATNGMFARAVAGQLGFTFQSEAAPLCGVRGRMRLAVLDGAVGPEEVREIVAALGDSERVTVVAKVILPGAEEALAEVSRGSKIRKAPRDLLTDDIRRVKRRRSQSGGTAT